MFTFENVRFKKSITLIIFIGLNFCLIKAYTGLDSNSTLKHELISVVPEHAIHLNKLKELQDDWTKQIDFWSDPTEIGRRVDIALSPNNSAVVYRILSQLNLTSRVILADLQNVIEKQRNLIDRIKQTELNSTKLRKRATTATTSVYEDFNPLARFYNLTEINNFMTYTSTRFNKIASITRISGKTFMGKNMHMIKIGSNNQTPIIVLEHGIHAREWASPSIALHIIHNLTRGYGNDKNLTSLVDKFQFFIIPVVNPDGYDYTWQQNGRIWRKNRRINENVKLPPELSQFSDVCRGVDINRNFNIDFKGNGSSTDPCSQSYRGPAAFSEPESQALRNLTIKYKGKIMAWFSMHAYSQLWMYPHGFNHSKIPDQPDLDAIAAAATRSLSKLYGTNYTYGPIWKTIKYTASGSTTDYMHDVAKIPFAYALEVRDTGTYGFLMPVEEIEPNAIEVWTGIKTSLTSMLQLQIKRRQKH